MTEQGVKGETKRVVRIHLHTYQQFAPIVLAIVLKQEKGRKQDKLIPLLESQTIQHAPREHALALLNASLTDATAAPVATGKMEHRATE